MRGLYLVGSGPVGSGRARVVEFSLKVQTGMPTALADDNEIVSVTARLMLKLSTISSAKGHMKWRKI